MVTKLIHKFYGDELGKAYDHYFHGRDMGFLNDHKFEEFAENHKEEIDQTLPYFKKQLLNKPIWTNEEIEKRFAKDSDKEKFDDLVWYFYMITVNIFLKIFIILNHLCWRIK